MLKIKNPIFLDITKLTYFSWRNIIRSYNSSKRDWANTLSGEFVSKSIGFRVCLKKRLYIEKIKLPSS